MRYPSVQRIVWPNPHIPARVLLGTSLPNCENAVEWAGVKDHAKLGTTVERVRWSLEGFASSGIGDSKGRKYRWAYYIAVRD